MRILHILKLRIRSLFRRAAVEAELQEEFQDYLEREIEAGIARGLGPSEARVSALRKLRGMARSQEECRDAHGIVWIEHLLQDARYALRTLTKNPGYTAAAVLALMLGIGTTTAVFSVVNAVLLKPFSMADADHFVVLKVNGLECCAASQAKFVYWRSLTDVLQNVTAFYSTVVTTTTATGTEPWPALEATTDVFRCFDMRILEGRGFAADEDRPGGPNVAVISETLRHARFKDDPHVVGRVLVLNGKPYTLIGVVSAISPIREFNPGPIPSVFIPFQIDPNTEDLSDYFSVVARAKPGISLDALRARLAQSTEEYRRKFPKDVGAGAYFSAVTLREALVGDVRPVLLLLFGAVGLVLLIACVNVASLMLARGASRNREIAVRMAIGAGRGRVIRQLLTESTILFLFGGVFGAALGFGGIRWLLLLNEYRLPLTGDGGASVTMDWRVMTFIFGVSLASGVLFSLFPAIQSSRDFGGGLKDSSGRTGTGRRETKARAALVVAEIGLAVVLVVGTALLIRSFVAIYKLDRGFETRNITILQVSLTGPKYSTTAAVADTIRRSLSNIRSVPGVVAAGVTFCCVPLEGDADLPIEIVGRSTDDHGGAAVGWVTASPGFLDAFRVPILRGRGFTDQDDSRAPAVALINERMAEEYWKKEDPLNDRIVLGHALGGAFATEPTRQIVGIVRNVRDIDLDDTVRPIVYVPIAQIPDTEGTQLFPSTPMSWVIRTEGAPDGVIPGIQRELHEATGLSGVDLHSMENVVVRARARREFTMHLMTTFGGTALVLAAIGIYGLMAYTVEQQRREIGIRLALGAGAGNVRAMILRQGFGLAITGLGIGLVAALGLSRLLEDFLFGVTVRDPFAFAATAAVLGFVALVAVWVPAKRASRIDPVEALRHE
jgi:predicted permease